MWKSKKLSPKVFQIDQFNLILYHGCRHIDHYPCYWKIPQHVAQGGAMWWNVPKMKKDKKIIKLPDSFKRYNYFRSSEVKIYPAKNLLMRSRNGLLATVLIVKLDLSNCVKKQTILNARFELQITCKNLEKEI